MASWRPRPALAAGALLLGLLALLSMPSGALADPNELSIEPAGVEVAPGGSAAVQLIVDPPATTLTIWAIDIAYDPTVVFVENTGCDPLDTPPGGLLVGGCTIEDRNDDNVKETVQNLHAFIYLDDGSGLDEPTVLGDITFEMVGEPGECTDLRLQAKIFADADAQPTNPLLYDGRICVEADAPPSGTAVPHTPAVRTSEPTVPGGDGGPAITLPPVGPAGDGSPGGGGQSPGAGTGDGSPGDASPGGSPQTQAPLVPVEESDDGPSTLFWVLVSLGGLMVVSAFSWAAVRALRGGAGPGDGSSAA